MKKKEGVFSVASRLASVFRNRASRWLGRRRQGPLTPGEVRNLQYDRETVEVMRRCMKPDSTGVDGGAHVGEFLKAMCDIARRGRHYAFEPIPELARSLAEEFPGVRVWPVALGDRAGRSSFCHVVNDPAYSGLRRRTYDRSDPEIETIDVEVVRLDDVIDDKDAPAFIKLDLEGGEYHALLGAVGTIRRCRPVIVFEAGERSTGHYGVTPEMIHALFSDRLGYALTTMQRWLAGGGGMDRNEFLRAYRTEFYFLAFPDGQ